MVSINTSTTTKILKPTKIFFVVMFVFLMMGVGSVNGAINTWTGTTNNNWNNGTNWSRGTAPSNTDDVVINKNASILVNTNPTINSLTITNNAAISFTSSGGASTITIDNTGSSIDLGSSLTLQGSTGSGTRSMSIVFTGTNRTMLIAGTLTLTAIGEGTIYNATNSLTTVSGTIVNDGSGSGTDGVITSTAANLSFASGGTYKHALDGGTIPTASWNVSSNCSITGSTTNPPAGINQTFGNFIWNCSQAAYYTIIPTTSTSMSIQGNLEVDNTGSYDWAIEQDITVNGDLIITGGTYRLAYGSSRTQTIKGDVTITGGSLSLNTNTTNTGTLNVGGNFSHTAGTIFGNNASTSNIIFNGTGGAQTYTSGGTATGPINFTVNNGAYLQMAAPGTTIAGTGKFTVANGGTLGITSPAGITTTGATGNIQVTGTRTYTAGANYIYNGTATQVTGTGLTQNIPANLTINNSTGVTLSAATSVSGILTLSNGVLLTTATNLLTLINTTTTAVSGGSSTSFINGPVKWTLPSGLATGSTYTFPVGSVTTYLPFALVNPITSGASSAQVQAFIVNCGGTANGTTLTSLSTTEYWSLVTTGNFTSSSVSVTRPTGISTYNAVGGSNTANGIYTDLGGTIVANTITSQNTIGTNRYFVLAKGIPSFIVSPTTLTGFTYVAGSGPSPQQQFTVSGSHLSNNIIITPPNDYEISTTSGSGFQSSAITLTPSSGTLSSTTIYVRLIAGLAINNYSENIIVSSTGLTTQNVALSGSVTYCISSGVIGWNAGISSVQFNSINNSSTSTGGYSDFTAQSTTVTNGSLYTLTVKTNNSSGTASGTFYVRAWIDWNQNGAFDSNEIYNLGSVTVPNTNTAISASYSIAVPVIAIAGSTRMRIISEGNVAPATACETGFWGETEDYSINVVPTLTTGTINNSPFSIGESVSVPFIAIGVFNTGNIFTAQLSNASGSFASPVTLGTLSATGSGTISGVIPAGTPAGTGYRIRVISSTPAVTGTDNGVNITIIAGASITRSVTALYGFNYQVLKGPSAEQSFTVSASSLTAPVIVTPPTDYEVSILSGGIFQSSPLSLPQTGGNVNATVYVRLKAGLAVGNYNSESIGLSSTGFASKNVTCFGYVAPAITAGGGGSYCAGSTINLTSSGATTQYWTGPNSFYSLLANPSITNAQSTNAGTYTVNGGTPSGINLVVNGDFSSGNTAFSTTYTLSDGGFGSPNGLWPEGTYAVIASPYSQHPNFCSCGDHTSGSGLQLVVNGAGVPQRIWQPTVPIQVIPYTDYQFTYWVQSVAGLNGNGTSGGTDASPSVTQLFINNIAAGPTKIANATGGIWTQFIYNWNSGSNTIADLYLMSQNTVAGGNDFALDDIVFQQVYASSSSVNVSIVTTAKPDVSFTSFPALPVNSGTNVTFTAVPVNGGTAPTYQWSVNGTAVAGATSSTYSYVPKNGDIVKCTMTSNTPCLNGGSPVVSSSQTIVVNTVYNYWYGGTSTDWGTASNWTAGYVPGTGDDVIFASTSNSYGSNAIKDLKLDVDRSIGNLTNLSPVALIIPPAKRLTVSGSITTNGASSPGSIYIQAYPDGTQPNGSLIFPNASNVYGTVEMYSMAYKGTPITVPNPFPPYGNITTTYRWQYFGIPLNGVAASPTFDGSYVRRWVESGTTIDTHWVSIDNGYILQPGIGYELTQDASKVIYFQGKLVNSDVISPQLPYTTTGLFPGQSILANPFTAALDFTKVVFGSDMQSAVWLYGTGSFGDWNSGTGAGQYTVVTPGVSGLGTTTQIPSMQGMLVQFKSGIIVSSSNSWVKFPYSAVIKDVEPQRVKEINDSTRSGKVGLRIDVSGSKTSDKMWIFSDSTCTRNFDNGWDGPKMLGSALSPQLYAIESDGEYQIDCLDDINDTQLGFQAGEDTEYTMTFTQNNLKSKYVGVYLVDQLAKKTVDITESGSSYSFTAISTPSATKRFKIVAINTKDSPGISSKIKLFSSIGTIFIQNSSDLNGNILIFDIAGHYLEKRPFTPNGITTVSGFVPGIYIAKAITNSEEVTKKMIVR